jgi:hypothetical protein
MPPRMRAAHVTDRTERRTGGFIATTMRAYTSSPVGTTWCLLADNRCLSTVIPMAPYGGVSSIDDLCRDIRTMTPEEAAWVRACWRTWEPAADLRQSQARILESADGRRAYGKIEAAWHTNAKRLRQYGRDSYPPGERDEDFWDAVWAIAYSATHANLDADTHRALRSPYLAGRFIGRWAMGEHVLVAQTAQALLDARPRDTSPVALIAALTPLAVDLVSV